MSTASRKRFAVEWFRMMTNSAIQTGEQALAQQCVVFAIREIGNGVHDSTHYFYNTAFNLHCESLGMDPDVMREKLERAEILVPFGVAQGESRWAA